MPEWVTIIVVLVGAVGGLSGVAALYKVIAESQANNIQTRSLARKTDLEALQIVMNELQEESQRRAELLDILQKRLSVAECNVDKLTFTVRRYRDGIRKLLLQLEELGIEPVWRPDENDNEV